MNIEKLKKLIGNIKKGKIDTIQALDALKTLPFEEMEFATLDTHRSLRQGFPEVILGQGKNHLQIIKIVKSMMAKKENILVTRVDEDKAKIIKKAVPKTTYNKIAKTLFIQSHPVKAIGKGTILVICAVTSEAMGNKVEKLYDVGVAGIHTLFHKKEKIFAANVLIVVAGMEGALPSVVGGLVSRPVIAVPTSIGYGANLGGLTTLLAMLNSCAASVTVVNIDNGFGAGYAASLINRD